MVPKRLLNQYNKNGNAYNMPNSGDIQALMSAISTPRLSSYRKFFQPRTDEELLAIYRWNEDVCATFSRKLKWVEVVLRNRFHSALSLRYGTVGAAASRDWYHHLKLSAHSRDSVRKLTHNQRGVPRLPPPAPDDVVAKLTFGFWPALLDVEQDALGQRIGWGSILVEVVPGHRQTEEVYWRALAHRDALFARLDLCKDLRNRIAHHEPIWKQGALYEETKPRPRRTVALIEPAPNTPDEALVRLQLQHDRVMELMHWLSPEVARMLRADPAHQQGERLLQAAALLTYRQAWP